jgi:hypothetical protein
MRQVTFNIYEIEPESGERHAESELRRIGATEIQITARDHDGEGAIRVTCQLPDSIRTFDDLVNATNLCL